MVLRPKFLSLIAAATLALLASPDRDVRLRVASLVRQIATARDVPTLEAAASTEQDPRVLSFLLTAAAR